MALVNDFLCLTLERASAHHLTFYPRSNNSMDIESVVQRSDHAFLPGLP